MPRMAPVIGSVAMMVAKCGSYFAAMAFSSSSMMCWTTESMVSTTSLPSCTDTSRERNCASSRRAPSFSDSIQPSWPLR